jgi:signal transduction histidine kinase
MSNLRIGIRTKLVLLLVAVALLPLLAALMTIVVGGRILRSQIVGTSTLALATSKSRVMQVELQEKITLLNVSLHEQLVLRHLADFDALSEQQRKELDLRWPSLDKNEPMYRRVVSNVTSGILNVILEKEGNLAEILVTDRFGQLVAATHRTTDYFQGDESWWLDTYNDGQGRVVITDVAYDRSADVWGVSVCLPIMQRGQLLGIVKAVLDIRRWLPESRIYLEGLDSHANLVLIREDGKIIHSQEIIDGESEPLEKTVEDFAGMGSIPSGGTWRVAEEQNIQAISPLQFPETLDGLDFQVPNWVLVLNLPEASARRGLAMLSATVLLVGLLLISGLFLAGVLLIDRSIINRIQRISRAARQVAEGELKGRADSSWTGTRVFGTDEIDDLARDFNNMVRKLQRSHTELTEANELKENFIRIAGHELRTPLSYIVGMSKLMHTCEDIERLQKAMDTINFKAGRLDEIIQSMFKLIPEQALSEIVHYEKINLSDLLEQIYIDMQPWIERRNQRLVIEPGEQDTTIWADPSKMRDIIENLVMNAIKFTPDGGQVKIALQRQLGGYVAIEVFDQGPGIPESDRPHIFEPFYSGSDVMRHSTGKSGYGKKGMGLGLAIVKHFTELHNGIIQFITSPSGSTFIVQLPMEPPPEMLESELTTGGPGREESAPGEMHEDPAGQSDDADTGDTPRSAEESPPESPPNGTSE